MQKSKKLKFVSLLLLVLVLSLCVVACNKKADTPTEESTSSVMQDSKNSKSETKSTTSALDTSITHTHSYSETIVKNATCVEKGQKKFTCSCGDSYTQDIPVLTTHTWDAGTVTLEPGCTTVGTKHFACTINGCSATKDEDIPASGHTLDNGTVKTKANCQTNTPGFKEFSCTVAGCNYKEEKPIAPQHSYGTDNKCTVCGKERNDLVLNFSDLTPAPSITSDISVNDNFKIIPGDKPLVIEATEKLSEDGLYTFTNRLKTGGASDLVKKRRLIQIVAPSAGTISVYAVSGSTTAADATTRQVILYGVTGEVANSGNLDTLICKKYDMQIGKGGNYFIGCNAGVSIYLISFTPSADSKPVVVESFSFKATDYVMTDASIEEQLSTNKVINDRIQLFAKSNGLLKFKTTSKTSTDGKTFTQRMTFNSKNSTASDGKGVLQITLPAKGKITLYVCSGSKTEDRDMCFTDAVSFNKTITAIKDYDPLAPTTSGPEEITPITFDVPSAGDYFLYSTGGASGSSVYFYELDYTPVP